MAYYGFLFFIVSFISTIWFFKLCFKEFKSRKQEQQLVDLLNKEINSLKNDVNDLKK